MDPRRGMALPAALAALAALLATLAVPDVAVSATTPARGTASVPAASATAVASSVALIGNWSGQLRLYEVKLARAVGLLPVNLHVDDDGTLSGTVGAAQVLPCRPQPPRRDGRIDYQARLAAPLDLGPGGTKSHLVLLVTRVADGHLSADLHLKARFGWDLGMHPGSLEAVRRP